MKSTKNNEINVVVLKDRIFCSKDDVIEIYIEGLKKCKTAKDFYDLLSDMYDETALLTGEKFVELQIRKNAEILENMRNNIL